MRPAFYYKMANACRRHAQLDATTAEQWLEEANLWSKLAEIDRRLKLLAAEEPHPESLRRRYGKASANPAP